MNLHMKLPVGFLCAVLFFTLSVQPCFGSEVANPPPPPTLEELSGLFRHVFIGEVVFKEVAETHYTFNVSEWLLTPLNTSQVQWTEGGGSVIMVSPSTTLYVGIDYLVYFDEIDGTQVGKDRHLLLLNGIDNDEMGGFRESLRALRAVQAGGTGAVPAVANHADVVIEGDIQRDLRPQALLVSGVLLLLMLKKLLKK